MVCLCDFPSLRPKKGARTGHDAFTGTVIFLFGGGFVYMTIRRRFYLELRLYLKLRCW